MKLKIFCCFIKKNDDDDPNEENSDKIQNKSRDDITNSLTDLVNGKSPVLREYRRTILHLDETKKYVLVIDDDISVRIILKRILTEIGFKVILLSKIEDIIPILYNFKKINKRVIVFLDNSIEHGEAFGFQITKIISKLDFIKVIGMSSDDIENKYITNGAYSFLLKPITKQKINSLFERKRESMSKLKLPNST